MKTTYCPHCSEVEPCYNRLCRAASREMLLAIIAGERGDLAGHKEHVLKRREFEKQREQERRKS